MKRLLAVFLVSGLFLNTMSSASLAQEQETESTYAENEVLVVLTDPSSDDLTKEGDTELDGDDITVEESWDFGNKVISSVSSDELNTEELIEELSDEDDVVSVEPNYKRKKFAVNDTYYNHQWYLDGTGSFEGNSTGINYSQAAKSSGSAPIVAVVDTGIDYTHEDLADRMWVNPYSSLGGTYGYDYASNDGTGDSDPMDDDTDGHGTHCAGVIAAATDNNTGIAGISDAKLMALKVFDDEGNAYDSAIINAFSYIYEAQKLGANIAAVNCSWGGGGKTSTSLQYLIDRIGAAGALFVFAAGNDGINHDNSALVCPYDVVSPYIVKVGASTIDDEKSAYSDYGKTTVNLFAPGDNILSTVNTNVFSPSIYDDSKREDTTLLYSAYDEYCDLPLYSAADIGQDSTGVTYNDIEHSSVDFHNRSDSGCAHATFTVSSGIRSRTVAYYLDVTGYTFHSNRTYYISFDLMRINDDTVLPTSWEHVSLVRMTSDLVTYNDRTYLPLIRLTGSLGSLSAFYIDNPAISVATTDTSVFGKYNSLSGTSMAAPSVSAAVALLAKRYADDNAIQRKERLLSCVRTNSNVMNYCSTGGILDLSKIATATYKTPSTTGDTSISTNNTNTSTNTSTAKKKKVKVKKIKLNKKKATLRYKKKLKLKATITPKNATNKKVKWYVSKKKYAKVSKKGVVTAKKKGIGHTVKVYAKAKDGSGKKVYCKIRIKKAKKK